LRTPAIEIVGDAVYADSDWEWATSGPPMDGSTNREPPQAVERRPL
jgi:hypothetical protein